MPGQYPMRQNSQAQSKNQSNYQPPHEKKIYYVEGSGQTEYIPVEVEKGQHVSQLGFVQIQQHNQSKNNQQDDGQSGFDF